MKTHALIKTAVAASVALASSVVFAESSDTFQGEVKDAWLTGKVETVYMLNEHLSAFSIDTDVDNGVVHLTGSVESEIDKDLAGELAEGIEGIGEVRNDLQVDADGARRTREDSEVSENAEDEADSGADRDFGTWADDATTTAAVKSRLLGNSNTQGLEIDVDTYHDVVTLSGRVASDEESELAEELARNTGDVEDVRNNLVVDPS